MFQTEFDTADAQAVSNKWLNRDLIKILAYAILFSFTVLYLNNWTAAFEQAAINMKKGFLVAWFNKQRLYGFTQE